VQLGFQLHHTFGQDVLQRLRLLGLGGTTPEGVEGLGENENPVGSGMLTDIHLI